MSATRSDEVARGLAELKDAFEKRCQLNEITNKNGSIWVSFQLEFVIAAAVGAKVAGNKPMYNALMLRAALFAAFGRDAFEVLKDAPSTPVPGDEAAAAGSSDGASHSG